MKIQDIINSNLDFLGTKEINKYFSPGRVNLIGEHIDYHGGNVFPTAINLGTYAFVTKREDNEFHFLSSNFKKFGKRVASLEDMSYKNEDNWANYAKGMVESFVDMGHSIKSGLNILIYGNLPNGAGLSSSASLEVLIGTVLKEEYNLDIDMINIVKTAKIVENEYIGVNCGIMDQFAVGMSEVNKAIYLNTDTLEYELVPLELGEYTLVIANTNKKRSLSDSKYNERREECDKGIEILKNENIEFNNLCDIFVEDYESISNLIEDKIINNRIKHAIFENDRTVKAVEALRSTDFIAFGKLMNESHDSLRDLYEVSCRELDVLVDSFRANGATGSRMTGAGFGGCTINLVKTDIVHDVIKNVKKDYLNKVGHKADFYKVKTSNGAKKLESEDII